MNTTASNVSLTLANGYIVINSLDTSFNFAFMETMRVILLVLVTVWRKEQPLRARGPLPVLVLLCQIFNHFILITSYWTNMPQLPPNVYPKVSTSLQFFSFFLTVTLIYLFAYQVVRFNIVTNFNRNKVVTFQELNNSHNYQTPTWYKIATSNITLLVSASAVLIFELLFSVMCYLVQEFVPTSRLIIGYIFVIEMLGASAIFILTAAGFMFWGFYQEFKHEGFSGYLSAVRDPLLFRFDTIVMLSLSIACVISVTGVLLQNSPAIIANPSSYVAVTVVIRIGYYLGAWGFLMISGLASCIMIIKRKLTKVPEVQEHDSSDAYGQLRSILNANGAKRRLFETFCKGEFCYENVQAYADTELYKTLTDEKKATELFHHMVNAYLTDGAVSEVNMPDYAKDEMLRYEKQGFGDEKGWKTAVDNFQRELVINMYDPFCRFVKSSAFKRMSMHADLKENYTL